MKELTAKYIDPFTDFGFKRLFAEEPNKDLLLDFLNCLITDQKIKNLTYNRVDKLGLIVDSRKAVFDIFCENEKGEKFIVELQKVKQNYFKDRSVYYSTFPIQEQAHRGKEWDFKLAAVYFIGVLDFVFEDKDKDKEVVTEVKLLDTKKKTVFYDKLTFIYLQMPNFNKKESELKTRFEKWLFVLKYLQNLQNRPKALQEKIFEKLFKIAEISKFDSAEKMDYEESVNIYRDYKNSVDTAREEGIIEGKIEVAKAMKEKKISFQDISEMTGLSREEIEKL